MKVDNDGRKWYFCSHRKRWGTTRCGHGLCKTNTYDNPNKK